MRYRGDRLYRADMVIGVEHDSEVDIESTAAHEFGHALGINGHSDSRRDLMYPAHFEGTRCRITDRDLDTLISIYPAIGDWLVRRALLECPSQITTGRSDVAAGKSPSTARCG